MDGTGIEALSAKIESSAQRFFEDLDIFTWDG